MKRATVPKIDVGTIMISAYLINMFHFKFMQGLQQIAVWGIVFAYLAINSKYVFRLFKNNHFKVNLFGLFLSAYVYFAVAAFIYGSHDISYIRMIFSMILLFLYLLVIIVRLMKQHSECQLYERFFMTYIYVMSFYVVISLIMFFVPSLKYIILNAIYIDDYSAGILANPYYATRIGWMGFSGYNSSLKCTIGCCMILYFIAKNNYKKEKNPIILWGLLALLLIGNFMYARTGFIISLVCVMIAIGYTAIVEHRFMKFLQYLFFAVIATVVLLHIATKYMRNSLVLQWAMEAITSILNTGEISSSSYDKLQKMYFVPKIRTLLFGDGQYSGSGGGYYMNTDVGLMRNILYFGVCGTFILYLNVVWGTLQLKISKNRTGILKVLFLVMFVGYEYKGESCPLLLPLIFICVLIINFDEFRYKKEPFICNK